MQLSSQVRGAGQVNLEVAAFTPPFQDAHKYSFMRLARSWEINLCIVPFFPSSTKYTAAKLNFIFAPLNVNLTFKRSGTSISTIDFSVTRDNPQSALWTLFSRATLHLKIVLLSEWLAARTYGSSESPETMERDICFGSAIRKQTEVAFLISFVFLSGTNLFWVQTLTHKSPPRKGKRLSPLGDWNSEKHCHRSKIPKLWAHVQSKHNEMPSPKGWFLK